MSKNKRSRAVYSSLVSFICYLCFLVFFVGLSLQVGLLSEKTLKKQATSGIVVGTMSEDLSSQLLDKATARGLSKNEWRAIVKDLDFEKDYRNYANQMFHKQTVWGVGEKNFVQAVDDGLNQYFKEHGVTLTEELQEDVSVFKNTLLGEYKKYMQPKWIGLYLGFVQKVRMPLWIAMGICLVIAVGLATIMMLQYHYKHRGIRYISFSLIATAITHFGLTMCVWRGGWEKHLGVGPAGYVRMIESFSSQACYFSLVMVGVEIILCMGCIYWMRHLKHNTR